MSRQKGLDFVSKHSPLSQEHHFGGEKLNLSLKILESVYKYPPCVGLVIAKTPTLPEDTKDMTSVVPQW